MELIAFPGSIKVCSLYGGGGSWWIFIDRKMRELLGRYISDRKKQNTLPPQMEKSNLKVVLVLVVTIRETSAGSLEGWGFA